MLPSASSPSDYGLLAPLKNRGFLVLWSGQALSQIADKVFFVFLIALLVNYQPPQYLENSMRSAVMIAATLPAVLLGSLAGILVDRYSKKRILTFCNFSRSVLVLAIPFLPRAFLILLAIAFLESVLTQFFAPAEQAAIPLMVSRQNLMSANALFTTTMMGALIVGFAIGEPLLSLAQHWSDRYGQPLAVGGLYLLAGSVLQALPGRKLRGTVIEKTVSPWQDFRAGLRYLHQHPLVSNAMLQLTLLYSVFAALTVLTIQLAEKVGLKSTQFGFLLAAAGIGMLLGGALLGHWGDRLRHQPLTLYGFLLTAMVLFVFSFTHSLVLSLGLSVLMGLGAAAVVIPTQTLIQQQTPELMHGKIFGLQNNIINIALSLPLAIVGPLTDVWGLGLVLVGMSVAIALSGFAIWHHSRRLAASLPLRN